MRELSLNVLDIAQNSIAAGASVITMTVEEDAGADRLTLSVEDNGCGFPPEMLASFPVKEDNGHVGLSNLYHTLQLIYGPAASLHISNAEPNGARVTIFLPEEENHAHPSRG